MFQRGQALVWWDQMFVGNGVVVISDGTGSGVVGEDVFRLMISGGTAYCVVM